MTIVITAANPETLESEVLCVLNSDQALSELRARISTLGSGLAPSRPGRKGRQVLVLGVEENCDVTSIKAMDVFDSALDASVALGYAFDNVGPALRRATRQGEKTAVLRGVEVGYADQQGND